MSLPVIHNGYYYDVSPSGMVTVTGPGINNSGISLSFIDTLTADSFTAAINSTTVTPAASQALSIEAQSVVQLKAALITSMQTPKTIFSASDPAIPIIVATGAAALASNVTPGPLLVLNEVGSVTPPEATVANTPTVVATELPVTTTAVIESASPALIPLIEVTLPASDVVNVTAIEIPDVIETSPSFALPPEVIATSSTQILVPAVDVAAVPIVPEPQKIVSTNTTLRPSNDFNPNFVGEPATTLPVNPSNTTVGAPAGTPAVPATPTPAANTLPDWRAKLKLAPGSTYLYNAQSPGILAPLRTGTGTDGIIFPYTPAVQVAYTAHYEQQALTHSNYKVFQYGSSSVDNVSITCDFTAQDTAEANYLLAVIHFLRSATKMFYGQDQMPYLGTPPPLVYLTGFGAFQFDAHPMAITSFNYTLPTEVDYIRAMPLGAAPSTGGGPGRLDTSKLTPGALTADPVWTTYPQGADPTYVPTKIQIQISAVPIVTRNDISNDFSLKKYATGALLRGSGRAGRGGIW